MLIPFGIVNKILKENGIQVQGILHVGAHECEEKQAYNENGIGDANIYWVDGNAEKIALNKARGIPNIYEALILDTEKEVDFHITKNTHVPGNAESSSILPLGVHMQFYPYIEVQEVKKMRTTTLENLVRQNKIPIQTCNFWNLDIQGVELEALKGAGDMIRFADAIYVEVNQLPLYQGCALFPELRVFLENKGFSCKQVKMAQQGWGDALFLRKL